MSNLFVNNEHNCCRSEMCPDVLVGKKCSRGDSCTYSNTPLESALHPTTFLKSICTSFTTQIGCIKTQPCSDAHPGMHEVIIRWSVAFCDWIYLLNNVFYVFIRICACIVNLITVNFVDILPFMWAVFIQEFRLHVRFSVAF